MMTRMERPTATMAFLLAAAAGDAPVAFAEEGVGPAGADGGLAEDAGQVAVAVPGRAVALLLAGGVVDAGCELRPGHQVPGGGEAGHVHPDLGDDDRGGDRPDAGDLIQPCRRRGERGDHLPRSGRRPRRCRRRCASTRASILASRNAW